MGKKYKCLVACEYSGIVREEFKKLGWDAWSCDLLDTEIPGQHIKGDALELIRSPWDLLVAFPPCTYLSNSGVRWLYNKDGSKNMERWTKMYLGAMFFKQMLDANHIKHICVENPIQHKYARHLINKSYSQIVHPWQHNHPETKATCLWLKNLPNIVPTNIVEPTLGCAIHKLPRTKDRGKIRSRTYQGIAFALATQFSKHIRGY